MTLGFSGVLDAGYDAVMSEVMTLAKQKGITVFAASPGRAGSGVKEYIPAPLK